MPEQVGRRHDQAVSFGVHGFESDERSDVLCPEANASSVSLSLAVPNLLFVVEDTMIFHFGVFRSAVGDEQTMLLTMPGFVDGGVTGFLNNGDQLVESIDFLYV